MHKLYIIGIFLLGFYFGFAWIVGVLLVSLLIALIPLAKTWFFFLLPIAIVLYNFLFGSSAFAWWCIIYAPFHYISFMNNVLSTIKSIFDWD